MRLDVIVCVFVIEDDLELTNVNARDRMDILGVRSSNGKVVV